LTIFSHDFPPFACFAAIKWLSTSIVSFIIYSRNNKKPDEAILAFIRLHFRLTQESNRADLKQNKKPPDAFTAGGL